MLTSYYPVFDHAAVLTEIFDSGGIPIFPIPAAFKTIAATSVTWVSRVAS